MWPVMAWSLFKATPLQPLHKPAVRVNACSPATSQAPSLQAWLAAAEVFGRQAACPVAAAADAKASQLQQSAFSPRVFWAEETQQRGHGKRSAPGIDW